MRVVLFLPILLGLTSGVAAAQTSESVARGFFYSDRVCGECHAVAAGEKSSNDPAAPTFDIIANTPGMTATALNVWLHTSHPTMPHLIVEADRIVDIAAYIGTLKRPRN